MATERSQKLFQTFFRSNFRVGYLHKLICVSHHPHLCLTQFGVSHHPHFVSLYGQTKRAHFIFWSFPVRISEWATYINFLFLTQVESSIIHICVSHNCGSLSFRVCATFEPYSAGRPHLSRHNLYTSQQCHIWALQPVSVARLSHPIVHKHCNKATFELCILILIWIIQ